MTDSELEQRRARAMNETLVIAPTEGGFRVYNPANITHIYMVSGLPDLPKCNCADFENHKSDPDWRCKHILAVLNEFEKRQVPIVASPTPEPAEEKEVEAKPGEPVEKKKTKATRNSQQSQLIIKRSVSPDGRIDSLSVEFSNPIDSETDNEIKERAAKALSLQSEIVHEFLNQNGKRKVPSEAPKAPTAATTQTSGTTNSPLQPAKGADGAVPAQLLNIAGMNTRSGWRLFINVQVNGTTLKLFGTKRELSDYVAAAGFTGIADRVEQGMTLNLPCRALTKPSPDGRYINVERVIRRQSRLKRRGGTGNDRELAGRKR